MDFEIHPLSEYSATLYFRQIIDPKINDLVLASRDWINQNHFDGIVEVVPAYASLTIFYDIMEVRRKCHSQQTAFDYVKDYLSAIPFDRLSFKHQDSRLIEIPVKYDGEDLEYVSSQLELEIREVIRLHTTPVYRVYMMGFLPGFAYLGGMNPEISMPRKKQPRLFVKKGSVGIVGNQTGIYPVDSPGGWQIIGKTDLDFFNPKAQRITLLETGDRVKFVEV